MITAWRKVLTLHGSVVVPQSHASRQTLVGFVLPHVHIYTYIGM